MSKPAEPQRPLPGDTAVVLTVDGGRYGASVRSVHVDEVIITMADQVQARAVLAAGPDNEGAGITLQWTAPAGLLESPANARPGNPRAGTLPVVLQLIGQVSTSQRRRFIRVPMSVPAQLVATGRRLDVQVVDLSESGASLFASGEELPLADVMGLHLPLADATLDLQVEVARDTGRASALAVSFIALHERDATAVRRALFARQRELRAEGRL